MVHASVGQTIEIKEGIYQEEVPIVKSVHLVGIGKVEIQTPDLQKVLSEGLVTGFSKDLKYSLISNIIFISLMLLFYKYERFSGLQEILIFSFLVITSKF